MKKSFFSVKEKWMILSIACANFMIFMDAVILPVALPTIQKLFSASPIELQWMVNSYLLSLAILIALFGKISDIFGHNKVYCLGIILFGIFSLFCALSQNSVQLIISRFFQGISAALLISSASPLQIDCFPENLRGRVIGTISSAGSLAVTVGPFVGGLLTEYLSWRFIFLINIPIAILGLFIALSSIPPIPKIKEKIDFIGAFSFMIAITCLTLAFMQGNVWGWGSLIISLFFFLFLAFGAFLFFWDKKTKDPFLDFSFFQNIPFVVALVTICVISMARMISIYWVIFFQNVLNFSPTYSGTISMISAIPTLVLSAQIGKFVDKKGTKISILLGKGIMILSLFILIIGLWKPNILLISSSMLFFGLGIVFTMIASYSSGLSSSPASKRGLAGGILNTFRNVSSSLGVVIFGAILINAQNGLFAERLKANVETAQINPKIFEGLLAKVPEAIASLKQLPQSLQTKVMEDLKSSSTGAMNLSNLATLVLLIIGFFLVLYFCKLKKKKEIVSSKDISKDQIDFL